MRRLYYHCGSHAAYNTIVDAQVRIIENQYKSKLITASQAKEKINDLQDDLRLYVGQSSSTPRRLI